MLLRSFITGPSLTTDRDRVDSVMLGETSLIGRSRERSGDRERCIQSRWQRDERVEKVLGEVGVGDSERAQAAL